MKRGWLHSKWGMRFLWGLVAVSALLFTTVVVYYVVDFGQSVTDVNRFLKMSPDAHTQELQKLPTKRLQLLLDNSRDISRESLYLTERITAARLAESVEEELRRRDVR